MKRSWFAAPVLVLPLVLGILASACSMGGDPGTTESGVASTITTSSSGSATTAASAGPDVSATTTSVVSEPTTTVTAPESTTTTGPGGETTSTEATPTTTGVTAVPGKVYTAQLTGAEVVPAVTSSATGTAVFTVDSTGTRMSWELRVENLSDVIASRVHVGAVGEKGSGLVILYPGPTQTGPFTGILSAGSFSGAALVGPLTGKSIADFVDIITSGRAYVNVGTVANPAGEIRGQLK